MLVTKVNKALSGNRTVAPSRDREKVKSAINHPTQSMKRASQKPTVGPPVHSQELRKGSQ